MSQRRRCIIHVGMHKTGSSSLQASLNGRLDNNDFVYMNVNKANHGNHGFAVLLAFKKKPWKIRLLSLHQDLNRKEILKRQERMRSEIERYLSLAASTDKTVILSGEAIVLLTMPELLDLKNVVGKYFDDVMIVAYVRSPKSYMQSMFQERLKRMAKPFDVAAEYPFYRKHFEKFDLVFGRENVQLRRFDLKQMHRGCVVRDFCHRFLGFEFPDASVVKKNESLCAEAVAFLYAYRKYTEPEVGMGAVKRDVALVKLLSKIKGKKFLFSERLVLPVSSSQGEDLKWIEDRIGESLLDDAGDPAGSIGSEEDLLQLAVKSVGMIEDVFPAKLGISKEVKAPEDVAMIISEVRQSLVNDGKMDSASKRVGRLEKDPAQKKSSRSKGKVDSGYGTRSKLVRAAFRVIRDRIGAAGIGETIEVKSLGVFRKLVVNETRCRIVYKAHKSRDKTVMMGAVD